MSHPVAQHYFEHDPTSASRPKTIDLTLPDLYLRLRTDRGVFSPDRLDLGTRVLLEAAPSLPESGRFLDLGCGYGPIALTMASRRPRARVEGIDVNRRSIELARLNAQNSHLDNVSFCLVDEDGMQAEPHPGLATLDGPFDAIWSNPPIRIGKPALHRLLDTWLRRLSPGGTAHLVVQKNLGADSLQRWLEEAGYPATRHASRAGYRILAANRRQ